MSRKRFYIITIIFLLLVLVAESFIWPDYFRKSVNLLKEKIVSNITSLSEKPFKFGFDFRGGTKLVYELDSEEEQTGILTGFKYIVEQRLEVYQKQGNISIEKDNLIVELSSEEDIEMITEIMKQVPTLEFREESEQEDFFTPTDLTGEYLEEVFLGIDQDDRQPLILLRFDEDGAKILEALTKRNEGKRLGIYIDETPVFPLNVDKAISGGSVQIKMNSSIEDVGRLTEMMKASSFSPSLKLVVQKTILKQEGQDSLKLLKKASAFGLLAIFWIMIIVYKLLGLVYFIVLLIYISLFLILFKLTPIIIDFYSISGFILSIGIVLNSAVLIFSKIEQEIRKGKNCGLAIEEGFQKSQPLIKKIHLIVLILAGILFFMGGTKTVQNFALSLFLGVLINILFIIFISQKILLHFSDTKLKNINWLWKRLK